MLFNFLSSPSLTDLPNKPFQSSLIFESEAGADPSGALSTENNCFLLSYVEVFFKALNGLCNHSSLFVQSISDELKKLCNIDERRQVRKAFFFFAETSDQE
jgi:hypothetical protein